MSRKISWKINYLYLLLLCLPGINGEAQTNTSCSPFINIVHNPTSVCSFTVPSFTATSINAGNNPVYQWKKNGIPVGTNTNTYSAALALNDDVWCELTTTSCAVNTTVASNHFIMKADNYMPPEVTTVSNYQSVCAGTIVTFTATNKSGNTNEYYTWIVNGTAVPASNSKVFSIHITADGTKVECMMTVPQCLSGGSTKDYSDPITISVSTNLKPSVTISTPASTVCAGSTVSFTAKETGAGANPSFQWLINGAASGTNSSSLTTSGLKDGDKVSCTVSTNPASNCGIAASASSNTLSMQVKDQLNPWITINASNEEVCPGTPVQFSAAVTDPGINPVYQWQVNGKNVGTNSTQFNSSSLKNGDAVTCLLKTTSGCNNATATSNEIAIQVFDSLLISFDKDVVTIWAGEQANLKAMVDGVINSFQWTPASELQNGASLTPVTKALTSSTPFTLSVISEDGCTTQKGMVVKVLHKLFVPNSFTPNGDALNDVFRIPQGVPITLKEFSVFNRWGTKVFTTNDPNTGWNGNIKATNAPIGTYVYIIKGTYEGEDVTLKGTVELIR
jgi:gliding motility-associated-like protein